jgi:hypothetical protein
MVEVVLPTHGEPADTLHSNTPSADPCDYAAGTKTAGTNTAVTYRVSR